VCAAALAAGLIHAGSAQGAITQPLVDSALNGSFSNIAYGDGSAAAFLTPLLYADGLGTGDAKTQSGVGGLSYSYAVSSLGPSAVEVDYTFQNMRTALDPFPNVTNLRLMVDLVAYGSSALVTTDKASEHWLAAVAGDPAKRQVQDFAGGFLTATLPSSNTVTDGANNCAPAGCETDLALQWEQAVLVPNQVWTVRVKLVDDPKLVLGGRYLQASSVDVPGNAIIFGNPTLVPEPQAYALILAGLGLISWLRLRRAPVS
jgi:hypothetical protein